MGRHPPTPDLDDNAVDFDDDAMPPPHAPAYRDRVRLIGGRILQVIWCIAHSPAFNAWDVSLHDGVSSSACPCSRDLTTWVVRAPADDRTYHWQELYVAALDGPARYDGSRAERRDDAEVHQRARSQRVRAGR